MAGSSVEVKGISRRFKVGSEEVWAVRDVTLSVNTGDFLALIGRSGSGKTTLMNLMAGLDRPTEGEISIDGERVDTMSEGQLDRLRRHKLGFVFQSFGLLPLLSARENVELPLRIAGIGYSERTAKVKRALDFVGLGKRADHRPYELSGGEQQRVAIARALASEPSLILADEPPGELDSATATAIFTLMRDLAHAEGITIVTCTHDRLVMEMASRVEELADGHLVTGERREVWERTQQRERSPFAASMAPAEGLTAAPAGLSSLIGADLSQFRPASERVVHREAEPHHDEEVIDSSTAHQLQEKRLATIEGARHEEPDPEPEVEPSADELAPEPDAGRWARPQD